MSCIFLYKYIFGGTLEPAKAIVDALENFGKMSGMLENPKDRTQASINLSWPSKDNNNLNKREPVSLETQS